MTRRGSFYNMPAAFAALLFAIALPAAIAPDTLVSDLEKRLAASNADKVNAYLVGRWSAAMVPFNQKTAACDLRAVNLAIRLSRTADAKAAPMHIDSIRAANGSCTVYVLAFAKPAEVP